VGDTATFASSQTPPTGEDHFHWYLRPRGEEYFTWIDGTDAASAALDLEAWHDGAEVMVRLFDHDHVILAESTPVRLEVAKADPGLTARVTNAPLRPGKRARVAVRIVAPVAPTGLVKVRVDGRVRGSTEAAGRVSVVLPRLAAGRHRLRLVYGGDTNLERAVVTREVRVGTRG